MLLLFLGYYALAQICLGCNDVDTATHISKKRGMVTTKLVETDAGVQISFLDNDAKREK